MPDQPLHRPVRAAIALALAGAVSAGCRDTRPPGAQPAANSFAPSEISPGTVHPTPDNLPRASELAASIPMARGIRGDGPAQRFARRLAGARQVGAFGAMEGEPSEVFGMIEDVVADRSGRLYVLDSRYNNVRIHDGSGAALASFGRPGGGPMEFRSPEALERDRAGRLLVADRHNRIKVFESQGGSYVYARSIEVPLVPEDFCLLGDQVVVQGVADDGFIHLYNGSGAHLRSFGRLYSSRNWLVRNQLSDGPIACVPEAGTVVTMFKYLPVVHGYGADGKLRWVSRLADFRPIRIVEGVSPRGQPRVTFDGGAPHDVAESLAAAPGGLVVVQTARITPESVRANREYAELRTYVLSARTGEGVYVGNHLPRISAVDAARVLAGVNDPFPQVRILSLAEADR